MPATLRRAQDRVGVGVRPDEDGVVARARARARSGGAISAAIQSASSAPVANASCADRRRAGVAALRRQPLEMPGPDLEPVRVVVAGSGGGRASRIGAQRAVVAAQHDRARAAVALAELEDVADRRAAER